MIGWSDNIYKSRKVQAEVYGLHSYFSFQKKNMWGKRGKSKGETENFYGDFYTTKITLLIELFLLFQFGMYAREIPTPTYGHPHQWLYNATLC